MKKAVIYANYFKQAQAGMDYAEEKGYQIIGMKNARHDIIGEAGMDVLLIVTGERKYRTYEEILFIDKMQNWYDVEIVECKGDVQ